MLDRIIALVSIAISFLAWFSPYVWSKLPLWIAQLGIYIGIFLFGIAAGLLIKKRISDKTIELLSNANLTLHFYGDTRTPQRITADNIWRWYYLRNIFSTMNLYITKALN